ncbi:MAG: hypothetical protein HRU20_31250 [Pseudomonadales bacterium]|nr:hypothetical protein [Pseudomonadales bacterium]
MPHSSRQILTILCMLLVFANQALAFGISSCQVHGHAHEMMTLDDAHVHHHDDAETSLSELMPICANSDCDVDLNAGLAGYDCDCASDCSTSIFLATDASLFLQERPQPNQLGLLMSSLQPQYPHSLFRPPIFS